MLEPYEGKLSRTVLRGGGGGNALPLTRPGRIAAGRSLDAHTIIYRLRMDHLCGPGDEARHCTRRIYKAKLHVGPGDQGEPVVTIMQPNED